MKRQRFIYPSAELRLLGHAPNARLDGGFAREAKA